MINSVIYLHQDLALYLSWSHRPPIESNHFFALGSTHLSNDQLKRTFLGYNLYGNALLRLESIPPRHYLREHMSAWKSVMIVRHDRNIVSKVALKGVELELRKRRKGEGKLCTGGVVIWY